MSAATGSSTRQESLDNNGLSLMGDPFQRGGLRPREHLGRRSPGNKRTASLTFSYDKSRPPTRDIFRGFDQWRVLVDGTPHAVRQRKTSLLVTGLWGHNETQSEFFSVPETVGDRISSYQWHRQSSFSPIRLLAHKFPVTNRFSGEKDGPVGSFSGVVYSRACVVYTPASPGGLSRLLRRR